MEMARGAAQRLYRWRRRDGLTLEVLRLDDIDGRPRVHSWVIDASSRPFVVEYDWTLDASWRTVSLRLRLHERDIRTLTIERAGDARWRVDGAPRADLEGCQEVDLSITPFCNTLALRRFGPPPGGAGDVTALYVECPALTCVPSRQRYERRGPATFLYIDLGEHRGFEAELTVDEDGLVREYAGLFERIEPPEE